MAIPSPATQQESSSRPNEDEEIRHTQEKASVDRQVLALPSSKGAKIGPLQDSNNTITSNSSH